MSRTVTVQNRGTVTLVVTGITSSDPQFTVAPASFSVSSGASREVQVTFRPTSAGVKYATLTITSNDQTSPTARLMVNGSDTPFTDVAVAAGVNDGGDSQGVAWGDYDSDGDQDLYVANNGNIRLYRNDGQGRFTEATVRAGMEDGGNGTGVAWGDYDNDGYLDLFAANNGENWLFRSNGDSTFTNVMRSARVNDRGTQTGAAWGDFDSDGDLDLYVASNDRPNRLYRNNRDGTFTNVADSAEVADTGNTQGVSWGDYDNDGDLDLYTVKVFQPNRLYRNNGRGAFTDVGTLAGVSDGAFGRGAAWGDYDNDGDLDLYVVNSGPNRLYWNNGNGTFTNVGDSAGVADIGDGYGCAWGDFDNDGDLDLYVVNSGSPHRLYRNDGNGKFTDIAASSGVTERGPGGFIAAWGDYDNDGDLDMYVAISGRANRLYRNAGNANRWLHVRLVGTVSNRSGIGAQVTAVTGATGVWAQASLPVEFGFGGTTTVDSLIIRWPNGIAQTVRSVATNQVLTVTEFAVPIFTFSTGTLTANTKIVFVSTRDGNQDIYSMNADGTNVTRLTSNGANDVEPAISPDGTKVVFQTTRDGNNEIYVMSIDGSSQTNRTNNPAHDYSPRWSPDGARIVFVSTRTGSQEIFTMNADGTEVTQLTHNAFSEWNPAYSPDGAKIAYHTDRDGNYEVYAMNADGSNQTRLTSNAAFDDYPVWSPDGTQIVFHSTRDGNDEVYKMGAGGTSQASLSNNPSADWEGAWSPDGAKVVFRAERDGNQEIYTMSADGSGQGRVTDNAVSDYMPFWSPFLRTVNVSNVNVGASGTATFTITNRGGAPLSVSGISVSGSDASQFTVFPTTALLAAGASETFTVTFSPTSGGPKTASLSIAHNAGGGPATVSLSGTGAAPSISLSATSISAGTVTKGSSETATFTVTNTGSGTLSITSIASSNPMFTASPNTLSLAASAVGTVTVTFTPTKVGWEQSALTITHNASGSPATVTANGIGRMNPPTGSLTNTRIAFYSNRNRNEIYSVSPNGSNLTSLFNTSSSVFGPVWSPDGSKITFWSTLDGNEEIYVMGSGGTDLRRLTSNLADDKFPSWSPDSARIAFASNRDGNDEIYVMNADGTGQTRLTSNPASDRTPSWSPDGTKIAFYSTRDGNGEIYMMDADGTHQTGLTNHLANDDGPSWSPDGARIAFMSDRDGNPEIYTMDANGVNQTRLTDNPAQDSWAAWSPFLPLAPHINLSDSSLSFGNVEKGQSAQQTLKIKNIGTSVLTISGLTKGTNAFSVSPGVPPNLSISPGDSIMITVTFSPTSVGARTDTLRITHNAMGSPSRIALSGTGVDTTPPAAPSGPASTVANNAVTLSWPASAEGDLSCYVVYRSLINNFTPTSADSIARVNRPATTYTNTGLSVGTYYFRVATVDSAGNKSGPSAQTSVTLAPVISLAPVPLHVGNVSVGMPVTHFLTVTNTGTAALIVSGMAISGADSLLFKVSSTTFTVEAGSSAQTVVTFTPTSAGTKRATLSIFHNAAGGVTTLDLSGTGIDATPPAVPSGLTATPGPNQVTLTWTGNGETDLSHYVIYRSAINGFTPASTDSIGRVNKPGATFTNTGLSAGTYYFRIAAADSAGNQSSPSPQASATLAPGISLSATALDFEDVQVGQSKTLTFTVSNTGYVALTVSSLARAGADSSQFTVSSPSLPFTINPGATAQTVTFAPASAGTKTASLFVANNAPGSPSAIALKGNGVAQPSPKKPVFAVSPASLDFGKARVRERKDLTLTVSNTGDTTLAITSISSSDTAFAPSRSSFSVPPGQRQDVTVGFTPPARGDRSGTLKIAHNADNSPFNLPVTGTGVEPVLTLSAPSVGFGDVEVGKAATKEVFVQNTGTADLSVTGMGPDRGGLGPFCGRSHHIPGGHGPGGADRDRDVPAHFAGGEVHPPLHRPQCPRRGVCDPGLRDGGEGRAKGRDHLSPRT